MDTSLHGGPEISEIFFLPNCAAERILYEKFFILFTLECSSGGQSAQDLDAAL